MQTTLSQPNIGQPAGKVGGAFKVNLSRGERVGRVSSEWFNRPADERYLSLSSLHEAVRGRADRSQAWSVDTKKLQIHANMNDPERLRILDTSTGNEVKPTHWSFGQLATQVGAPASYLRKIPAPLAAMNLQYGLNTYRPEIMKILATEEGSALEMRALTGADYGRIWDYELVEAVMKFAGNGTGDTDWKIPGCLDWATMRYNPYVDVTTESTTLYASDRDVFLFLVDDTHPIEAGRLPNGDPDLYFRGFYAWNSEVGSRSNGVAAFYLRGVCMNRNLWGVENFKELTIRHSKHAANRFAYEAAPALARFATSSAQPFVNTISQAKSRVIAKDDDGTQDWLRKRNFTKSDTADIMATVFAEEGHPARSVFDVVQGITAVARKKTSQDERIDLEKRAGKLLEAVN